MKPALTSFVSGVVFALGLGIGGMTQPAKVVGFLDFAGNWDPSLAFVMIGAIAVHALFYRMFRNLSSPLLSPALTLPTRTDIDLRLVGGAVIFGLGWGLAGFCPGPALTSLASGNTSPVIFSVAMIVGMLLYEFIGVLRSRQGVNAKNLGDQTTADM